jgi:pyruvate/2-oxoglutarate/acetoin dehydrogenase E1 component/TPP-dependent pyruvate/acetoin dehydrogenase alpha subunit
MTDTIEKQVEKPIDLALSDEEILADYRLAYQSRQASLIGRREVMSGKAKFGIFGDGKEVVQLAMAKVFQKGDFRSGYYRDQTFMFATGQTTLTAYFAQLYAHADVNADPMTAGRCMNAHFATRFLDDRGEWLDLTQQPNSSSDISPTGSQMPRLVGLAYASRLYRELKELSHLKQFSNNGREITFGTIGNASCAEGMFWEALNAIGVLKSPAVIVIYDDDYGISVTNEHQHTKQNLSELLKGFQREPGTTDGFDLYTVRGWDYPALVDTFRKAAATAREEHVPAVIHVTELTQPQGHSTSGSHERYKSKERLAWEEEFDALKKFREWILTQEITGADELDRIEAEARQAAEESRRAAWEAYIQPILEERQELLNILEQLAAQSTKSAELRHLQEQLKGIQTPLRRDLMTFARSALIEVRSEDLPARAALQQWKCEQEEAGRQRYDSYLYRGTALQVPVVEAVYDDPPKQVYGFEVLNACFDAAMARDPRVIAFGEDVGKLGDVNQGFRGLQDKYGPLRVSDTGIRETTIVGQAIGMAMRGLRPIAEIQYLDYLLYALQILSDDLATLLWRTHGGQKAPAIIRTRGHRLEGVWHSGSLMAGIIHLVRGMYVLVPRNMTQAAGFYNTLLQADEPALVVEALNGYRIRENMPANIGEFTVPLGVPEILRPGTDVTLVTYGSTCRIVLKAAEQLSRVGIEAEVIDVQSLLPFDRPQIILESLKKTSRIAFIDEDVPGGTTAYMMQEVLEKQGGYEWLDSAPVTIPGKEHRPAYGSDGDYWSKPNVEQVFETVYEMMNEVDPKKFPLFF